jgi:hypothetical protein
MRSKVTMDHLIERAGRVGDNLHNFAQISGRHLICTRFAQAIQLHMICTRFDSLNFL